MIIHIKLRDVIYAVSAAFGLFALWKHLNRPKTLPEIVAVDLTGFTAAELRQHNGEGADPSDILVSVCGVVYRVSPQHYGVGANYHCFAGTEASYRLGKSLLTTTDANRDWRHGALSEDEMAVLHGWESTISRKYPAVGWFLDDSGNRWDS